MVVVEDDRNGRDANVTSSEEEPPNSGVGER